MHMYNDIFILKLHITNNNNENDFRHRFLKHLGQMKKKKTTETSPVSSVQPS